TSLDVELVEIRSLREGEFAAFFKTWLRPLINQFGKFDVLGVFRSSHSHVATDKLHLPRAAHFQVRIKRRTKVLRVIHGHAGAVDVEEELRNVEAIELRAAGNGELPTPDSAFERFINLRLMGIEDDAAVKIRKHYA